MLRRSRRDYLSTQQQVRRATIPVVREGNGLKFMSAGARFFAGLFLAMFAQTFVPQCRANESGWFLERESALNGKSVTRVSASGYMIDYPTKGYTFVMSAPEWKPTNYNKASKIYYKGTVTEYIVKMTHSLMVGGIHDIDSEHWSKPQTCLLDGKRAVKYVFRAKNPDATVKVAECWFATEIPVAPAVSELEAGIDRVPREPHLLIRLVFHKFSSASDQGHIIIETKLCKKMDIAPNTYACPKGYRFVSGPVEVVMGNIGKDVIDEIIDTPVHH
jgi:hypothetical protein